LTMPHIEPPHAPRFGEAGYRGRTETRGYDRVTSFVSDVTVERDGRLTVHEAIRVDAEGYRIRHGIFRDLPTYDHNPHGDRSRLRLDIVSVKRDYHDEPYTLDMLSHAWRIRIGDADVRIPRGPHVYEITYRTNRRIGFFSGYDEIYWNVTGNAWEFA